MLMSSVANIIILSRYSSLPLLPVCIIRLPCYNTISCINISMWTINMFESWILMPISFTENINDIRHESEKHCHI